MAVFSRSEATHTLIYLLFFLAFISTVKSAPIPTPHYTSLNSPSVNPYPQTQPSANDPNSETSAALNSIASTETQRFKLEKTRFIVDVAATAILGFVGLAGRKL